MGMHQMLGPSFGSGADYEIERSLRFNTADSAYLNRTPSSASSDRTIWTFSFWIKICEFSLNKQVFTVYSDGSNDSVIRINGNNYLEIYNYRSGSYQTQYISNAQFRDPSAWYHFVVSANGSTSLNAWVNGEAVTWSTSSGPNGVAWLFNNTGNHQIGRYNTTANSNFYLAEVNWVDGQALAASSFGEYNDDNVWVPKEYSGTYGTNGFYLNFSDNSSNAALGTDSSGNSNTWTVNNLSAAYNFGLTNAAQIVGTSKYFQFPITYAATVTYEYFIKITTDGTYNYGAKEQGTNTWNIGHSGNSVLFGNFNSGWTTFSNTGLNNGAWHFVRLTTTGSSTSLYVDGSLIATNSSGGNVSTGSQVTNRIEGTGSGAFHMAHLRITTGGTPPTTGVPDISSMNAAAGSGGTLVFYDKLDDIASSGTKTSDGGNVTITMNAATVGVTDSSADSLIDTPTNGDSSDDTGAGGEVTGSYCTWNPLVGRYNDTGQSGTAPTFSNGNLNVSGGQINDRIAGTFHFNVGQAGKYYWEVTFTGTPAASNAAGVRDYSAGTSSLVVKLWYYMASTIDGGPATSFTTGDVLGFAMDLSAGTIDCYKNGGSSVGQMNISSLTSVTPFLQTNSGVEVVGNFGQRPFVYAAPSGFKALCTATLADPTIADGSDYFDIQTYTGTGASQTLGGLSFSADFFWRKCRSTNQYHNLVDSVRGLSTSLITNGTFAESSAQSNVSNVTSTGYDIGTEGAINTNNETYVAWLWDAGSSTVSNTDGSATSSVRASTTSGFSIVAFTGAGSGSTFGHGLNAAPHMIIVKDRNVSSDWCVYHKKTGGGNFTKLNSANATAADTTMWGNTDPTSSVFGWGYGSGNYYIAYCFAPVEGFSAFGKYTGNGNANGPFVYTGFRPRWVMVKSSSNSGEHWLILDTKRDPYNISDATIYANLDNSEYEAGALGIDILSNGFKPRGTNAGTNASGYTYIYAAFAEHPFSTARAR